MCKMSKKFFSYLVVQKKFSLSCAKSTMPSATATADPLEQTNSDIKYYNALFQDK
jgi:hypothetical protein